MLFSSISFLYYFLPWVLIVYYLFPWQFKNAALLVSSLFFYAWGGLTYTWLMVVVIASERRKLAGLPRLTWDTVKNGEFMDEFEEYVLDQFPMQD